MFFDFGLIIVIATFFAIIARYLRQPLIPVYIITGLIIGPGLGFITDIEMIKTVSEIGIAFLLFIVGLELDFRKLQNIGFVASVGGSLQVITIFILGFLISMLLGFGYPANIYWGLIAAFSSTMVVIKMLADKGELSTLHGRIIIGILLMQDVFALIAITTLSTLNNLSFFLVIFFIFKGLWVMIFALVSGKFLLPPLFKFAAKSQDLLFLLSISTCFGFAMLFTYAGFSLAIGAFIAGLALASLPYSTEIIGKVKSLRDFFATIFFVSLGLELSLVSLSQHIPTIIIFSVLIVILKPLFIAFIASIFGYTKRNSFLSAISLGQVSEFSLILVAQGLLLGHITQEIFSLTIVLTIITIGISSYFIKFDKTIYNKISHKLKILDRVALDKSLQYGSHKEKEVILVGYHRIAYSIVEKLHNLRKDFIVIDYNPDIIRELASEKITCLYGDISDPEILQKIDFKTAKLIVSTIPEEDDNKLLLQKAKDANPKVMVFVTANQIDEALELYDRGADYVIMPHFLGGEHTSLMIEDTQDFEKLLKNKMRHVDQLQKRRGVGQTHHKNVK